MSEVTGTVSNISDEMRAAIGKELGRRTSYPISASDIRKWAIAVYFPEPPPARFVGAGGPDAPLVAPHEFNPFAWAAPGRAPKKPDVTAGFLENQLGIAPPPLNTVLNGGTVVEYGVPMMEGDVITANNKLDNYFEKQGKRGLMLFSSMKDEWTNQRGEMVKRTTSTVIRL
jgi:N-terminal half of MaoC dehydratase